MVRSWPVPSLGTQLFRGSIRWVRVAPDSKEQAVMSSEGEIYIIKSQAGEGDKWGHNKAKCEGACERPENGAC